MVIKLIALYFLIAISIFKTISFAQGASIGETLRTEELLQEERLLREKIAQKERVLVKKISVKGITILSKDEIKEIILPFKKHWLTREDIRQIIAMIRESYKNKGHIVPDEKISYQIKKSQLIIEVQE